MKIFCVGLLSFCFQMFDSKHIPKLTLLECLPLIINNGTTYTYLSSDLAQYLPKLQEMATSNVLEYNSLTELINTIYCCCTNVISLCS